MTADDAFELERQLHELEERLMGPGTRSSRRNIEELLAEEFVEIGSSGTEYDRESVISAMVLEKPVAWSIANFKARALGENVALVTYTATKSAGPSSVRCSIWKRYGSQWKIVFHQGTSVHDLQPTHLR
jgi:hypothetical protein